MTGGVIDRGRVALADLLLVTHRHRLAIDAVSGQVVTGVAADVVVFRQPLFKVQHPPERDFLLGNRVVFAVVRGGQRLTEDG